MTETEVLWEEIESSFLFRCQGIPEDRVKPLWEAYKEIIKKKIKQETK